MPVPSAANFQFGDSGTTPAQCGHRTVRAQSQFVG